MWTPKSFEIWMFKWPQLVWSFDDFSKGDKQCISALEPWHNPNLLFYFRATGAYSSTEFHTFLSPRLRGVGWLKAYLMAVFPATLANLIFIGYYALRNRGEHIVWYDLLRSCYATKLNRWIAKIVRQDEYNLWVRSLSDQLGTENVK